jgi:y4mF family transcriptional regulator
MNFPERDKSSSSGRSGVYFLPNGKMEPVQIDSYEVLGPLIRRRRQELGLNQTELAGVAGTSLRFVSELERGKRTAQLDGVLRVLAALGIRLEASTR